MPDSPTSSPTKVPPDPDKLDKKLSSPTKTQGILSFRIRDSNEYHLDPFLGLQKGGHKGAMTERTISSENIKETLSSPRSARYARDEDPMKKFIAKTSKKKLVTKTSLRIPKPEVITLEVPNSDST